MNGQRTTLGERPSDDRVLTGFWPVNWECMHCKKAVSIALYQPWPDKCPQCGVWQPRLKQVPRG